MSPVASSRWCPTPEQLMILEELYRSGIRTPNASQIQRITAHLSLYGKIEGKNAFYWFQNHKARDRQKLRRKLIKQLQQQQHHQLYHHQLLDQNEFPNHHLLGSYFDSPVVTTTTAMPFHQQITCHDPSCLLSQEGLVEGSQSSEVTNCRRKIEGGIQENVHVENGMMKMYGHDWMMMVDHVGPPVNPCCSSSSTTTTRPLKTLQLFPVTSTNLKQVSMTIHRSSIE